MKQLTTALLLLSISAQAQISFTEVIGTPFEPVYYSSIAFADVDGDNDEDVLITGLNSSWMPSTILYINDGSGIFTEAAGTSFEEVTNGSIAFADVDGDNDQDVLITGESSGNIAKLYTNNGSGFFTEVIGTPFAGVKHSSIAFADVDGDNDQDVLITGEYGIPHVIAKLYTNNGSGTFTEVVGTPFDGVNYSSIAFADVDGDNDQDVLITGNGLIELITKLYTNNGSGTFTEVVGTPFNDVAFSSIAFADVDGDNDQDVLITGDMVGPVAIAKLYTNNGSGTFTEVTGTPFDAVNESSIAFADVDGDNDQDVLITGRTPVLISSPNYTATMAAAPLPKLQERLLMGQLIHPSLLPMWMEIMIKTYSLPDVLHLRFGFQNST